MRLREEIEKREERELAPWAQCSARSLGRLVPEAPHAYRTEFQRDRDRVTHSRAFRRLQYKTQVLPYSEGDHFRNRLTHTLEVAQIARTVARSLGANEDLTEAIVLAHDLGHPPFGHAGERVLHGLMAAHGGFEHNRQSLRTVDHIERRTERYRGLNLTHETRAGILKHGAEYPVYGHPVPLPELGGTPSIEAQIANLCDAIAYHAHDIDDGVRAGLLRWDELLELDLWQRAVERVATLEHRERFARQRATAAFIDLLTTDLIETSARRLEAAGLERARDVNASEPQRVRLSETGEGERQEVGRFLHARFYSHHMVVRMTAKAERVLGDIWAAYARDPRQLPPHVLEGASGEPEERAIADYVAGMTDRFAMDEHRRLFDPHSHV